ncbi:hypothetical protein OAG24_00180 [bacterium]|nr:hypothetical protein [bacterium]
MAETSMLLILIVSIIFVFIALVFSAMAVRDAKKSPRECQEGCHKYSLWAAIATGLTSVILIVALVMHAVSGRKGSTTGALGINPSVFSA